MMDRQQRIESLFTSALERPLAERDSWLREACKSDPDLLKEIASLLAHHRDNDSRAWLGAVAAQVIRTRGCLQPGTRLGAYEIQGLIGAGGMGEVYRARDLKLNRDVAIKILPDAFSGDGDRLARFSREAHLLASLNHPNIAAIYGIEERALIMELVEGQTLAERIAAGRLPVKEALPIAHQIADALECAHEKGIMHRDLKPANVKLRPDGTVKVLDFGLAKVTEPASRNSATITQPTQAGAILGTPGYMSPEQIRGQQVDKRTDIWAFGVLLCELLTGATPFERPTVSDTTAAILTTEPDLRCIPVETRRLVQKCLEKDPRKRLRDVGDAWNLLDAPPPGVERHAFWSRRLGWIAVAVLGLTTAALAWRTFSRAAPEDKPLMRLDVDLGPEVSIDLGGAANIVISPDGSRLAYVSRGRLFVQNFDEVEPVQIAQGANTPFFSPDGQWIAYFSPGQLRKIPVKGGAAIDLCPSNSSFTGGAWGSDGNIIAALSPAGPLVRILSSGGTPKPLTQLDRGRGEVSHRLPQILPGGQAIIFTASNSTFDLDDSDIDVVTLADGHRKNLVHGGTFGRYLPSGHLTYINRGVLYAMPFDITRLEARGKPIPVLKDVVYSPVYGSAQVDVSSSGMLISRAGGSAIGNVTIQILDSRGAQQPLIGKPGPYMNPRVSPDGERVVLLSRRTGLSVYDRRRDVMTMPTHSEALLRASGAPFAVWTPDSRFIVFRGEGGMYWIRADSAGEPRALTTNDHAQTPTSFSPDGKTLAYHEGIGTGPGGAHIWTVSVENDGSQLRAHDPHPFFESASSDYNASFSPDGRWLAYASTESGPLQVYVRSWPDTGRKWQISSTSGFSPVFARRGSELFFLDEDGQIMATSYRASGEEFIPGRSRVWSEKPHASLGAVLWSYDAMPDGNGVAALVLPDGPRQQRAQNHVIVLQNFFDYLKRVAPAK